MVSRNLNHFQKRFHLYLLGAFTIVIGISVALFIMVSRVNHKIKTHQNAYKAVFSLEKELKNEVLSEEWRYLPRQLKNRPFADDDGIVLSVKKMEIEGIKAPYNPSIIEKEGGYWLFFRYNDFISHRDPNRRTLSHIGAVELDGSLSAKGPVKIVDTGSAYSEDARAFRVDGGLFLSYNDLMPTKAFGRSMRIAELDESTFKVKYSADLDLHINFLEKNWIPFTKTNESGKEEIFFAYQLMPHKIMHLKDPSCNSLDHLYFPGNPSFRPDIWPKDLGTLRGGTPARLINDGEYLSFFHSSFLDPLTRVIWYVMGAYTFEAKAPYRITAISEHPILFKGIYDTSHAKKMNKKMRCVFPSGYAIAKQNGKDVIFLSIGENDSGVKLLTLDKEKLLKSLKKIDY